MTKMMTGTILLELVGDFDDLWKKLDKLEEAAEEGSTNVKIQAVLKRVLPQ